jgi:hypothetical protein
MPDETFAHGETGTNLGFGAALSVLDALAAGKLPKGPSGVQPGMFKQLFADPNPLNRVPLLDEGSGSFGVPEPTPSAPEAPAPSPRTTAPEQAAAPAAGAETKKGFTGGDKIDFNQLDLQQAKAAFNLWESARTPRERAVLLGAETEMGMAGKNPKTEVVENITNAKTPEDLFGYLQKRLIKKATGGTPKMRQGTIPRKTAAVEQPSNEAGPVAQELLAKSEPTPQPFGTPPDQSGLKPVRAKRPGRQDVLRNAPRLEDGTLDWDKLDAGQRDAVVGLLGKNYREKVRGMSLANIQKVLSNAQLESFLKALKRQPRATAEAAPIEGVAQTLDENLLAEPADLPEVKTGGAMPRKFTAKSASVEQVSAPEQKPTVEQELQQTSAAIDAKKVSPGWWDSDHATPAQKKELAAKVAAQRQMPGDPEVWAKMPFDQLPPFLRHGLPQQDAPAFGAEGGAPQKGANFRAKRKGSAKP